MGAKKGAFETVLETGWARLRDQIARMTRREDAEDLLHEAWIGIAERQVEAANAAALLARSAANRGIDAYRRERRIAAMPGTDAICVPETIADLQPLQDEMLIARHRLERLRLGVARLSPRTREIFLMHRLDGRKYREIAQDLGISQSAVEKHIARAMAHLTDWMEHW
ncbi:RNA polymerase sigma-70 factor, ECF subfamily [Sphingomonas sp. NFR04]|uniref:RNA polymerase sigma factor n=1 Tax=Sphingomonas sp. NFR04 TaxID=1566283 RepID=UPI0008E162FD|nr:sigma-70 family RNA polymerase sigma factor [Sphingomonas sp. NFR04]SFJ07981.1 RNA polymerase sigma-70 factor, ECF subfamily [Sphingomonas sp. NFR04]